MCDLKRLEKLISQAPNAPIVKSPMHDNVWISSAKLLLLKVLNKRLMQMIMEKGIHNFFNGNR
jgi:hypothetical protein